MAESGLSAFTSYLFSLRNPSGTLLLRRGRDAGDLLQFSPQDYEVRTGHLSLGRAASLVANFAPREKTKIGCILRRPRLCTAHAGQARLLRPARRLWPVIRQRTTPGSLLSPSLSGGVFNRMIVHHICGLGYPDGSKYSPRAFRRGAAQALFRAVSNRKSDYLDIRSYIDAEIAAALKISRALVAAADSDSESDCDQISPAWRGARIRIANFPGGAAIRRHR